MNQPPSLPLTVSSSSPYLRKATSVRSVMLQVLLALIPGIAVHVWQFGSSILTSLAVTIVAAVVLEAGFLALRKRPLAPALGDFSAVLTACLLALTFPPGASWWLLLIGIFFAIVVAKHLYGGLGQNPFNPAMIGFAVCIVSYPALMSQWPNPADVMPATLDAMTNATPLDALKTGLKLAADDPTHQGISTLALQSPQIFGVWAGRGFEWLALAYLGGGLFLWARGLIRWRVSLAFLSALTLVASALWLWRPEHFADPLFHLFSGGVMLGAFFIATDPVTCATTPKGQWIFGFGAGLLTYLIRVFGGYPDGVAFAILFMNLAAPLIDVYTQPPVFGMKKGALRGGQS